MHGQLAVRGARPLFLRFVPIEFHPVLVGIAQVQRFADAMVGRAVERDARRNQPPQRIGQCRAGRIENGGMIQPLLPGGGDEPPRLSQVFRPMWW